MADAADEMRRGPRLNLWGREIPFRNRHFTGRDKELGVLHDRLSSESTALIFGMGGIGKTEIAAEYAHRHRDEYDLVWWIRAEQEETIINAYVALGRSMDIPGYRPDDRDHSVDLVLAALRDRDPYRNWLLVFDNAQNASVVSQYIPAGGGHVIITSRERHWRRALRVDGIEVSEFQPEETVEFLRRRVPALADPTGDESREAASELARELGNLPLAAEHAAAYLIETGTSVEDYLRLFRDNAHGLLASEVDINYPHTVAATWSVSRSRVSEEAAALFTLLAFFSAEPISEELLVQPTAARSLPEPLDRVLSGITGFRRAVRELGRYSLLKLDGVRNVVQLHRVVQAVTRDRLAREDPEAAKRFRDAAHTLLAASDPGSPEREENEPVYHRSFQHLLPSGAVEASDPLVRRLIINQVERLYLHRGYSESLRLGEQVLERWRELHGPDDRQTLALAVQVGAAMRLSGRWEEACAIHADTLERLREGFGEDDAIYLTCARIYGIDLRLLGRYSDALDNDLRLIPLYEREFRAEHPATLRLRNNVAVSLRCIGRFDEALRHDEETLAERLRIFGPTEDATLSSQFGKSRDLRGLGRYEDALDLIRQISEILRQKDHAWDSFRLLVASDFAVALRRAGYYADAFAEGRRALELHRSILGPERRQSLLAATNLINDHRLNEDLTGARRLGEETMRAWEKIAGPHHPNSLSACANLAIVLRVHDNPQRARELNERALAGFEALFGDKHPSTLIVAHNLASDLAVTGETRKARELGESALERSLETRGPDHPCTLATMANLSLDRRADGDAEQARLLHEEVLAAYRRFPMPDHPHSRLAAQHGRINLDIEPMHD